MKHAGLVSRIVRLTVIVLLLSACSAAQLMPTPVPVTTAPLTDIPPTPVLPTKVPPSPRPTTPPPPTPTTAAVPALNPSPRGYVSLAYDVESDRGILFGGQTGHYRYATSFNNETWTYDVAANKWTEMKPSAGPGARGAADLAYDAESDRVLLFGGAVTSTWGLDDTWAYDFNTNTWQEMANGPANHLGYRIAYDAESDRVILFGGLDMTSGKLLSDTWSYDFNSDTWKEMKPSTSPSPRNFHAMAYDAESDRVIMWGGDAKDWDKSVWAYDFNQNTWEKKDVNEGPDLRAYASLAYDSKADRMFLYGGTDYGDDETWAYDYDTNTWTKLSSGTNPGELSRHAMLYSTTADRVILFGGQLAAKQFEYTADTWNYDPNINTWTSVTPQP